MLITTRNVNHSKSSSITEKGNKSGFRDNNCVFRESKLSVDICSPSIKFAILSYSKCVIGKQANFIKLDPFVIVIKDLKFLIFICVSAKQTTQVLPY